MMSGASGTNFNLMSGLVANNTATVANTLGCTQSNPNPQALLECMRSVPFEKLMNTSVDLARSTRPPFGELAFYPSFDGDYISTRPSLLLRQGNFVKGFSLHPCAKTVNLTLLRHTHHSLLGGQRWRLVCSANYHRRRFCTCKFQYLRPRSLTAFVTSASRSLPRVRLHSSCSPRRRRYGTILSGSANEP